MDKQSKIIAALAKKILPDCIHDVQFDALIPVFRIKLAGVVQVGASMSSISRFVLRCISLQVNKMSNIAEVLGLEIADVGYGAAELRSLGLIESQSCESPNDTAFNITALGHSVIENNAKLFKLRKQSIQLDFNPLTGHCQSSEDGLINVDEARKRGDFVEPIRGKRPRSKNINIHELREIVKGDGQLPEDADLVGIAKMDEPFMLYRPVTINVLRHRESGERRILVFKGRRHLGEESQELQRLLDNGKEVIQPGIVRTKGHIQELSVSPEESQRINSILKLEEETDELESVVEGNIESAKSVAEASEKEELMKQNTDLIKQLDSKAKEMEKLKSQFASETDHQARHISANEHWPFLIRTLREAATQVLFVTPWIKSLDDELYAAFSQCLSKGVNLTIVWGLGTKWGSHREQSRARSKPAIEQLKELAKKIPNSNLVLREEETHERLLYCDNKFIVIGSYHWLGPYKFPNCKDSSLYTERRRDIEVLIQDYKGLLV